MKVVPGELDICNYCNRRLQRRRRFHKITKRKRTISKILTY